MDLKMRIALDQDLKTFGTGDGHRNTLDLTPIGITGIDTADLQIVGESAIGIDMDVNRTWIEGFLVKRPQDIITKGTCGLSYKKNLYVVFVKSQKSKGLYFNDAVSAMVEAHYPNNKHFTTDDQVLTIIKTYQQATTYVDSDTNRYWNRIYIECEAYSKNQ